MWQKSNSIEKIHKDLKREVSITVPMAYFSALYALLRFISSEGGRVNKGLPLVDHTLTDNKKRPEREWTKMMRQKVI